MADESEKKKTRIPKLRFRQAVRKAQKEKEDASKATEGQARPRRSSIPRLIAKPKPEEAHKSQEEDEFDKIYDEIALSPLDLDSNVLNTSIEDPDKVDDKFEEIIHAYEDIHPVKQSKIPTRHRNDPDIDTTTAPTKVESKSKLSTIKSKIKNAISKQSKPTETLKPKPKKLLSADNKTAVNKDEFVTIKSQTEETGAVDLNQIIVVNTDTEEHVKETDENQNNEVMTLNINKITTSQENIPLDETKEEALTNKPSDGTGIEYTTVVYDDAKESALYPNQSKDEPALTKITISSCEEQVTIHDVSKENSLDNETKIEEVNPIFMDSLKSDVRLIVMDEIGEKETGIGIGRNTDVNEEDFNESEEVPDEKYLLGEVDTPLTESKIITHSTSDTEDTIDRIATSPRAEREDTTIDVEFNKGVTIPNETVQYDKTTQELTSTRDIFEETLPIKVMDDITPPIVVVGKGGVVFVDSTEKHNSIDTMHYPIMIIEQNKPLSISIEQSSISQESEENSSVYDNLNNEEIITHKGATPNETAQYEETIQELTSTSEIIEKTLPIKVMDDITPPIVVVGKEGVMLVDSTEKHNSIDNMDYPIMIIEQNEPLSISIEQSSISQESEENSSVYDNLNNEEIITNKGATLNETAQYEETTQELISTSEIFEETLPIKVMDDITPPIVVAGKEGVVFVDSTEKHNSIETIYYPIKIIEQNEPLSISIEQSSISEGSEKNSSVCENLNNEDITTTENEIVNKQLHETPVFRDTLEVLSNNPRSQTRNEDISTLEEVTEHFPCASLIGYENSSLDKEVSESENIINQTDDQLTSNKRTTSNVIESTENISTDKVKVVPIEEFNMEIQKHMKHLLSSDDTLDFINNDSDIVKDEISEFSHSIENREMLYVTEDSINNTRLTNDSNEIQDYADQTHNIKYPEIDTSIDISESTDVSEPEDIKSISPIATTAVEEINDIPEPFIDKLEATEVETITLKAGECAAIDVELKMNVVNDSDDAPVLKGKVERTITRLNSRDESTTMKSEVVIPKTTSVLSKIAIFEIKNYCIPQHNSEEIQVKIQVSIQTKRKDTPFEITESNTIHKDVENKAIKHTKDKEMPAKELTTVNVKDSIPTEVLILEDIASVAIAGVREVTNAAESESHLVEIKIENKHATLNEMNAAIEKHEQSIYKEGQEELVDQILNSEMKSKLILEAEKPTPIIINEIDVSHNERNVVKKDIGEQVAFIAKESTVTHVIEHTVAEFTDSQVTEPTPVNIVDKSVNIVEHEENPYVVDVVDQTQIPLVIQDTVTVVPKYQEQKLLVDDVEIRDSKILETAATISVYEYVVEQAVNATEEPGQSITSVIVGDPKERVKDSSLTLEQINVLDINDPSTRKMIEEPLDVSVTTKQVLIHDQLEVQIPTEVVIMADSIAIEVSQPKIPTESESTIIYIQSQNQKDLEEENVVIETLDDESKASEIIVQTTESTLEEPVNIVVPKENLYVIDIAHQAETLEVIETPLFIQESAIDQSAKELTAIHKNLEEQVTFVEPIKEESINTQIKEPTAVNTVEEAENILKLKPDTCGVDVVHQIKNPSVTQETVTIVSDCQELVFLDDGNIRDSKVLKASSPIAVDEVEQVVNSTEETNQLIASVKVSEPKETSEGSTVTVEQIHVVYINDPSLRETSETVIEEPLDVSSTAEQTSINDPAEEPGNFVDPKEILCLINTVDQAEIAEIIEPPIIIQESATDVSIKERTTIQMDLEKQVTFVESIEKESTNAQVIEPTPVNIVEEDLNVKEHDDNSCVIDVVDQIQTPAVTQETVTVVSEYQEQQLHRDDGKIRESNVLERVTPTAVDVVEEAINTTEEQNQLIGSVKIGNAIKTSEDSTLTIEHVVDINDPSRKETSETMIEPLDVSVTAEQTLINNKIEVQIPTEIVIMADSTSIEITEVNLPKNSTVSGSTLIYIQSQNQKDLEKENVVIETLDDESKASEIIVQTTESTLKEPVNNVVPKENLYVIDIVHQAETLEVIEAPLFIQESAIDQSTKELTAIHKNLKEQVTFVKPIKEESINTQIKEPTAVNTVEEAENILKLKPDTCGVDVVHQIKNPSVTQETVMIVSDCQELVFLDDGNIRDSKVLKASSPIAVDEVEQVVTSTEETNQLIASVKVTEPKETSEDSTVTVEQIHVVYVNDPSLRETSETVIEPLDVSSTTEQTSIDDPVEEPANFIDPKEILCVINTVDQAEIAEIIEPPIVIQDFATDVSIKERTAIQKDLEEQVIFVEFIEEESTNPQIIEPTPVHKVEEALNVEDFYCPCVIDVVDQIQTPVINQETASVVSEYQEQQILLDDRKIKDSNVLETATSIAVNVVEQAVNTTEKQNHLIRETSETLIEEPLNVSVNADQTSINHPNKEPVNFVDRKENICVIDTENQAESAEVIEAPIFIKESAIDISAKELTAIQKDFEEQVLIVESIDKECTNAEVIEPTQVNIVEEALNVEERNDNPCVIDVIHQIQTPAQTEDTAFMVSEYQAHQVLLVDGKIRDSNVLETATPIAVNVVEQALNTTEEQNHLITVKISDPKETSENSTVTVEQINVVYINEPLTRETSEKIIEDPLCASVIEEQTSIHNQLEVQVPTDIRVLKDTASYKNSEVNQIINETKSEKPPIDIETDRQVIYTEEINIITDDKDQTAAQNIEKPVNVIKALKNESRVSDTMEEPVNNIDYNEFHCVVDAVNQTESVKVIKAPIVIQEVPAKEPIADQKDLQEQVTIVESIVGESMDTQFIGLTLVNIVEAVSVKKDEENLYIVDVVGQRQTPLVNQETPTVASEHQEQTVLIDDIAISGGNILEIGAISAVNVAEQVTNADIITDKPTIESVNVSDPDETVETNVTREQMVTALNEPPIKETVEKIEEDTVRNLEIGNEEYGEVIAAIDKIEEEITVYEDFGERPSTVSVFDNKKTRSHVTKETATRNPPISLIAEQKIAIIQALDDDSIATEIIEQIAESTEEKLQNSDIDTLDQSLSVEKIHTSEILKGTASSGTEHRTVVEKDLDKRVVIESLVEGSIDSQVIEPTALSIIEETVTFIERDNNLCAVYIVEQPEKNPAVIQEITLEFPKYLEQEELIDDLSLNFIDKTNNHSTEIAPIEVILTEQHTIPTAIDENQYSKTTDEYITLEQLPPEQLLKYDESSNIVETKQKAQKIDDDKSNKEFTQSDEETIISFEPIKPVPYEGYMQIQNLMKHLIPNFSQDGTSVDHKLNETSISNINNVEVLDEKELEITTKMVILENLNKDDVEVKEMQDKDDDIPILKGKVNKMIGILSSKVNEKSINVNNIDIFDEKELECTTDIENLEDISKEVEVEEKQDKDCDILISKGKVNKMIEMLSTKVHDIPTNVNNVDNFHEKEPKTATDIVTIDDISKENVEVKEIQDEDDMPILKGKVNKMIKILSSKVNKLSTNVNNDYDKKLKTAHDIVSIKDVEVKKIQETDDIPILKGKVNKMIEILTSKVNEVPNNLKKFKELDDFKQETATNDVNIVDISKDDVEIKEIQEDDNIPILKGKVNKMIDILGSKGNAIPTKKGQNATIQPNLVLSKIALFEKIADETPKRAPLIKVIDDPENTRPKIVNGVLKPTAYESLLYNDEDKNYNQLDDNREKSDNELENVVFEEDTVEFNDDVDDFGHTADEYETFIPDDSLIEDDYQEREENYFYADKNVPSDIEEYADIDKNQYYSENIRDVDLDRQTSNIENRIRRLTSTIEDNNLKKAKSLAELDLGDAVKGKVHEMKHLISSFENLTFEKTEVINPKEMPRRKSVSEKIALFEGKLSVASNQTAQVTSRSAPRKDQAQVTDTANEEIQRKIQELDHAKRKYERRHNMTYMLLADGHEMPVINVGTCLIDKRLTAKVVAAAIDLGYRGIDAAYIYGNEKEVGEGIRQKIEDGTVTREELFVSSKLWSTFHRTDLVEQACRNSLATMGLDYFDQYMIHNPMSFKEGGDLIPKIANVVQYSEYDYLDAWYGLEQLVTKGLVRTIGVSNFNESQLQKIIDKARVKPVVNQVECHPYLSQARMDVFCSERNVSLSCYGVLGSRGTPASFKAYHEPIIDDPLVKVMAAGIGITPSQLLIRYQIQQGRAVIVKSTNAAHLYDNLQSLDISLTDAHIDALNALNRNRRMFTFAGMGDTHKNYPFKF